MAAYDTENSSYAKFATRIIRRFGERIAEGDVEALAELADLQAVLDTALDTAVLGLFDQGYSNADVARVLRITRQAVSKRWGHRRTSYGDLTAEAI